MVTYEDRRGVQTTVSTSLDQMAAEVGHMRNIRESHKPCKDVCYQSVIFRY